jgi:hypothetical protein|tara:strand:+ start:370 stop:774 length:405 start_codon:yes stop_codon:yes gene_type:complete
MTDAIYFSKTTCGFYIDNASEAIRPDDAIEITREVYDDIFEQQRVTGKKIIGDENGYPTLDTSPIPTEENKRYAGTLLSESDWVTLADVIDETNTPHLTNYSEFIEYRRQLRTIFLNPLEGVIEWPTSPTAVWS